MTFTADERATLLAVKGVGPTVIARLEQLGIASLADLAQADARDIVTRTAAMLRTSCWKNSPQAQRAIKAAIAAARGSIAMQGQAPPGLEPTP